MSASSTMSPGSADHAGARLRRLPLLPPVLGLTDGILTALTLGAGHMLAAAAPATPGLAFRVAGAAAVSGAFVFLVAHYADLDF